MRRRSATAARAHGPPGTSSSKFGAGSLGGLDLNFARSGIGRMAKRNFAAQSLFSCEFKLMGRRAN